MMHFSTTLFIHAAVVSASSSGGEHSGGSILIDTLCHLAYGVERRAPDMHPDIRASIQVPVVVAACSTANNGTKTLERGP